MPQTRQKQISLDAPSTYHCVSRCVRRHYLCGQDPLTGKDFSHRSDWIRTRIFELQAIFAIEVCAYAIMSNHAHLVLCVQQDATLVRIDKEVATRWLKLFGGKPQLRGTREPLQGLAERSFVDDRGVPRKIVQHFLVHALPQ